MVGVLHLTIFPGASSYMHTARGFDILLNARREPIAWILETHSSFLQMGLKVIRPQKCHSAGTAFVAFPNLLDATPCYHIEHYQTQCSQAWGIRLSPSPQANPLLKTSRMSSQLSWSGQLTDKERAVDTWQIEAPFSTGAQHIQHCESSSAASTAADSPAIVLMGSRLVSKNETGGDLWVSSPYLRSNP